MERTCSRCTKGPVTWQRSFELVDHKDHRIPPALNLPANQSSGVWIPVLREPLLPLPSARGFADEKDFCRACDACSTVGAIIGITLTVNRKVALPAA